MRAGPRGLWRKRWAEEVELAWAGLKRLSLPQDSHLSPPEGAGSAPHPLVICRPPNIHFPSADSTPISPGDLHSQCMCPRRGT